MPNPIGPGTNPDVTPPLPPLLMPLPLTGQITSLMVWNAIRGNESPSGLSHAYAAQGGYAPINQKSTYKPRSTPPYALSDWYGYNHTQIRTTAVKLTNTFTTYANCSVSPTDNFVLDNNTVNAVSIGDTIYITGGVNMYDSKKNGDNKWWGLLAFGYNYSIKINTLGRVTDVYDCSLTPIVYPLQIIARQPYFLTLDIDGDEGVTSASCNIENTGSTVLYVGVSSPSSTTILVGMIVYTNVELTNPFIGNRSRGRNVFYSSPAKKTALQIDESGTILSLFNCN